MFDFLTMSQLMPALFAIQSHRQIEGKREYHASFILTYFAMLYGNAVTDSMYLAFRLATKLDTVLKVSLQILTT